MTVAESSMGDGTWLLLITGQETSGSDIGAN